MGAVNGTEPASRATGAAGAIADAINGDTGKNACLGGAGRNRIRAC